MRMTPSYSFISACLLASLCGCLAENPKCPENQKAAYPCGMLGSGQGSFEGDSIYFEVSSQQITLYTKTDGGKVQIGILCPQNVTTLGTGSWQVLAIPTITLLPIPSTPVCALIQTNKTRSGSTTWDLTGHLGDGQPPSKCPTAYGDGTSISTNAFSPSCSTSSAEWGARIHGSGTTHIVGVVISLLALAKLASQQHE